MKINLKNNGAVWAGMLTGLITQMNDTMQYMRGKMDKKEFALQTAENVTGAVGIVAGIEYGAILGSAVMPGVGTALGSIVGGLVGDKLGRMVGHHTGNIIYNQPIIKVKANEVSVTNNMTCPEQG